MAARKPVLHPAPARPELERLIEAARMIELSDELLQAQRISFAYGNAPACADRITKESVMNASRHNRLIRKAS
ncbi:MAG: hypothetical protein EB059_05645 [Alphaproteobacteria bacterium]|nr:hypothetical protein [Alphaproteobacteria bacterium]